MVMEFNDCYVKYLPTKCNPAFKELLSILYFVFLFLTIFTYNSEES